MALHCVIALLSVEILSGGLLRLICIEVVWLRLYFTQSLLLMR